ncbi:MAG: hypothetical protein QGF59_30260, partial [Pirellulaceae bacterium]|jgi:hypothetical protein|nr:hypothetical protein [Pirellulaceae bacterium]
VARLHFDGLIGHNIADQSAERKESGQSEALRRRPCDDSAMNQRHEIADGAYVLSLTISKCDAEVILDVHHEFNCVKAHDFDERFS